MKKLFAAAAVVCSLTLAACGGDVCSGSSKCSADTKPTDAQITACKDLVKDGAKCASQYKSLAECMQSNQVCGSDNKTDGTATAAKCTTQLAAYTTCFTASTDGGT